MTAPCGELSDVLSMLRESAYYKAGFAHGLGLKVILTCKEISKEHLHFDIAHYNFILRIDPEDLRKELLHRIGAWIGQGPRVFDPIP